MSGDIRDDPEFIEWELHVRKSVVPKMADSALTVQLFPNGEPDIKFAVELGLSILLDKPIIVVCEPGQILPDKMLQVADKVVEVDWRGNPQATQEAIADAISNYVHIERKKA
jgi:hypothetical protein